MTKDEALMMAIEEIEGWIDHAYGHSPEECADNKTIMACKEALEQPAQEPVAWMYEREDGAATLSFDKTGALGRIIKGYKEIPLYAHPHQGQECKWCKSREVNFDEDRIDIVGQNGNEGLHYEEIKDE